MKQGGTTAKPSLVKAKKLLPGIFYLIGCPYFAGADPARANAEEIFHILKKSWKAGFWEGAQTYETYFKGLSPDCQHRE